MSPSAFHMPSTKNFRGHFRSSPSSAQPASSQPSNTGTRRLVSRPDTSSRGARTTKTRIPSKYGQLTNETPSELHHTAGSYQAQSSPDVAREIISIVSSDSEETGGAVDTPQIQPHNPSSLTPYTTTLAQNTFWDVTTTVLSSHEQQLGQIYVYRDPNSKDSVYKVGTTMRRVKTRLSEHKRCCAFEPEELHNSGRDINNSVRLEKLIGWALGEQRMLRTCPNRVHGHQEWFKAEKETVIETVRQFENFMDHEQPYDVQGNLNIVWRYLLRNRSPKADDVRKLCAQTRKPQWAEILGSPTYQDYAYAYLSHAGSELRRFYGWKPESYWQLSTVIYGLWTLALSQNVVAFYALIIVLACVGNARLPESQYHSEKSKKRRTSLPKKDTVRIPYRE